MHVAEGIHSTRLAFLRNHLGARIWRLRRAWSFATRRTLQSFVESAYQRRRELKEATSPSIWVASLEEGARTGRLIVCGGGVSPSKIQMKPL